MEGVDKRHDSHTADGLGVASGVAWLTASVHRPPAAAVPAIAPLAAVRPWRALIPGSGGAVVVYVAGEVARPGVYRLPAGSRAEAAVRAAGGLRPGADPVAVNLAERVEDGEEIAVPAPGEAPAPRRRRRRGPAPKIGERGAARPAGARQGAQGSSRASPSIRTPPTPVTLETLPGIGPGLAARIVEFRDANGPFALTGRLARRRR